MENGLTSALENPLQDRVPNPRILRTWLHMAPPRIRQVLENDLYEHYRRAAGYVIFAPPTMNSFPPLSGSSQIVDCSRAALFH